ncbi:TPA: transmembrane HD family hydrolase [Klebsiella michiganensis]
MEGQDHGKMVTDGTLLSLDDFWSFQSNLYQTIITVLIALNGIVAAFSFLIIKNSSTAKAKEEARDIAVVEVNQYVESSKFEKEIKKILYEKIEPVQFDLLSQISSIDEIKLSQQEHNQSFEKLEQELDGLKRNLKLIAESISLKDTSDEDGGNFILGRRT